MKEVDTAVITDIITDACPNDMTPGGVYAVTINTLLGFARAGIKLVYDDQEEA